MNYVRIEKSMSYHLRHNKELKKVCMSDDGWVLLDEFLIHLQIEYPEITMLMIEHVVKISRKQRFEIKEKRIRACQGHSLNVNLNHKEIKPPDLLYHGTNSSAVGKIVNSGAIKSLNRNYVHLSSDTIVAKEVGGRRGKPVVMNINSKAMYEDGIKFYKSTNGVWLTEKVTTKYILGMS